MGDLKTWISGVFDRAASEYGKSSSSFFTYFGKRLVEHVAVAPGQHVLDIATGRGAVLFPLAEAVGETGKVVGIDISPQMIQETAREVAEKHLDWVELRCMDAERLDFPDESFDCVFCGFALFFMPSIPAALCEFKRVLKPGGTLAVSIWGTESELHAWMNAEIKKLCDVQRLMINPLRCGKELQRLLEEAHFEVKVFEETQVFSMGTPEAWWDSLWNRGTRAKFEQLTPEQLADLRNRAIDKARSMDEVLEQLQVFYGVATKGKIDLSRG